MCVRERERSPSALSPICEGSWFKGKRLRFSFEQLLHGNVQRFRGGLVFKADRLCVSLNSGLEINQEQEDVRQHLLFKRYCAKSSKNYRDFPPGFLFCLTSRNLQHRLNKKIQSTWNTSGNMFYSTIVGKIGCTRMC